MLTKKKVGGGDEHEATDALARWGNPSTMRNAHGSEIAVTYSLNALQFYMSLIPQRS